MDNLVEALADLDAGRVIRSTTVHELRQTLAETWVSTENLHQLREADAPAYLIRDEGPTRSGNLAWAIDMSDTFRKAVRAVDARLRGRILTAIVELSDDPLTIRGDTLKPLMGTQKGCWRYRLGDYRLVYMARIEKHSILLIDFAARGAVYD